ncbi:MAG: GNAT family N-acetyltransferase [Pseudomonadota bacterium]
MVDVGLATRADRAVLLAARGLFDWPAREDWLDEFLNDPRHHLMLARRGNDLLGFLSAVHYVHPDKAPEIFVNELGVLPPVRRQGIGTRLVAAVCAHGRRLGCACAWVLADPKEEALSFYKSLNGQQKGEFIAMFTFDLTGDTAYG